MKAKAAILRELNAPLSIEVIEIPALGIGQVLVEVRAAGICGAQIREITGAKGADKYLPHLLGHEGAGVVLEVGPGVTKVIPGDHVVLHWRKGTGIEAKPPVYQTEKGRVGAGPVSTFATRAVISENRMTVVEEWVHMVVAALLGCGVTTGLGIVNNEARVKIGQSIAVAGVGGVGLNVIQGAVMVSAHPIIAIDLLDEKLEKALDFGATHLYANVREMPHQVDVFVDCTGNTSVIAAGFSKLAPGGKLILVGQPRQGQDLVLADVQKDYNGKTILDSQGGLTNPDIDIPRYVQLYNQGRLNLDDLITHRFSLSEINQAIDVMKTGQCCRIILEPQEC
jgi:S-(hydroxymethyl)glutathione dehydrogenase/alcohol dehydrogenase